MLPRRRFLGLALGALAALLTACADAVRSIAPPTPSVAQTPTPVPPTASAGPSGSVTPSPVGPSLRERIAQMLLVGFRGANLADPDVEATRRSIAELGLGGVLLFSVDQLTGGQRNVTSSEQLRTLVSGLSEAAPDLPLVVAIDQEGGRVARLGPSHGFPATPSAAELGRGDPATTRQVAREMAETLASVGVTLNLAPVVDLAINPDNPIIAGVERAFSADAETAIAHASAFIEAHHEIGIACAIKHFPGQGSAGADTHLGVVDVSEAWTEAELRPFAALVETGLPDAVLTAHIFNAALDPAHPATLSRATITGIMRERIGFDGTVISDDLQMGAIRDAYGFEEAVALAIEAGVDVLLIANQLAYEPDIVARTIDLVEGLVREGRIDEARIEQSWQRISRLRG